MNEVNHILWRIRRVDARRFHDLRMQLNDHHPDSNNYLGILDQIRSLPGFPHHNDPNRDVIHLEITD